MTRYVELDFETRSLCDLKVAGGWRYAEDVTTEVMCLVYSYDGETMVWWPGCNQDGELCVLAQDDDTIFVAHNAAFEQAIWQHHMVDVYGFPPIPVERWDCTLAACAWKGLPLALDKAGRALRLNAIKDKDGNKLTLGMSKYDKHGNLPALTAEKRARIIQYCAQDVMVERGVMQRVGLISQENKLERGIWIYDQKINQRGVRLDMPFVEAMSQVVRLATVPLLARFTTLTGLQKVGSPRLKDWCAANGVPVENLQKGYLAELLGSDEDDPDPAHGYEQLAGDDDVDRLPASGLPDVVREVLGIRTMLGGAAVKKLKRMGACVGYDGRARGLLQYHAAHSGRWGGRLLQPQNFPRETTGLDPEDAVRAILSGEPGVVERATGLGALDAVARCLRHALIPDEGKVFLVGDYAQIEARIVLALAGQHDKTKLMADGFPVYFDMAEDIYNIPKGEWACGDEAELKANKAQFQAEYTIGKNTILGCCFQMGANKFHSRYCPKQPMGFAEDVVRTYREDWAPKVPKVWYALEEASLKTVETGSRHAAYGITFAIEGEWLTMTLPNLWQKMWYYKPHIGTGRFGNPCWKFLKAKGATMIPVDMYGGIITENAVQAMARGIMCGAIDRLERAGFPVVLTVHDEIICEVDGYDANVVRFQELMEQSPGWAEDMGIPIAVETWVGTRYRK